jgi:hypothetical protein
MQIELLWFDGCPNHESARAAVAQVLASRGLEPELIESIRVDAATAVDVQFPGSPTIRVDGRDIEPHFQDPGTYALSCRVYATSKGLRGQPETTWIEQAIDHALSVRRSSATRRDEP